MDQLITAIDHITIGRMLCVAGSTFWFYDYLITCGYEYTGIWPTRLTLVKVLYIINRYITVPYLGLTMYHMLGVPEQSQSSTFCRFYITATMVLREVELFTATWLMLIRVRALYGNIQWASWVLYSTFVITHLLTIGFGIQSIVEAYPTLTYSPLIRVCISGMPTYISLLYFIQIPFELLLLGMQLMHYWKLSRAISPVRPTTFIITLYTDGVLYFIGIISVRVWAGVVVLFLDPTFWYMTIAIDVATTSTLISRIFLHLFEVSSRSRNSTSVLEATSTALGAKISGAPDTWVELATYQHRNSLYIGKI